MTFQPIISEMYDLPGPSGENKRTNSDVEEELLVSSDSDVGELLSSSEKSRDPSEKSESSDTDTDGLQNDNESNQFGYIGVVGAADLQLSRGHTLGRDSTPESVEPSTPSPRGNSPVSSSESTSVIHKDKMDVIEICSSDDERDPVAKINKKLMQLKNLTVGDGKGARKNQENIMRKGMSSRRKVAVMPMILNTMSLSSTNNIQTDQSINRSTKNQPMKLPSGITVKSVPKNKPIAKKGSVQNSIQRTKKPTFQNGQQVVIPNDVIQMLRSGVQNSKLNSCPIQNMKNSRIAQSSPITTMGNGLTITKVTHKPKINQITSMPQNAMISIPKRIPGPKRKTQEAASVPTPKKKNSTDSLMTKLKNNKNIVMTSTIPTATDKENKQVRSSESIDFVNLDDSDDDSKENNTIMADSDPAVEILDLDYEPSTDRSIFPKETPKQRGRKRKKSLRNIDQNETTSASSDMELLEDNMIIGRHVNGNFSFTSGMSEGECIGIDDNDIQIVDDDKTDSRIGSTINIASAIRTFNGTPVNHTGNDLPNLNKSAENGGVNRRVRTPVNRKSDSSIKSDKAPRVASPTIQTDSPKPSLKRLRPERVVEPMVVDPEIFDVQSNSPKALENDVKNELVNQKPPADEEYRFSALYQRFIDLCFELDDSEDMVKIVEKKVKTYYKSVNVHFVTSVPFEKLVIENMDSMKETPAHKHLYIKNVVDELKAKRNKRASSKSAVVDVDSEEKTPGKRWVSDKHLEKLEKALSKLQKAIKMLEEKEVNFDEEDDSVYLMTERYKARAVRVFEKLCSLRGVRASQQNPAATVLRRGELGTGPGIPALTTWLMKGGYYAFPDYRDVLECIKIDLVKQKLIWTEAKMEEEAQKIFLSCGRVLQGARKATEWAGAVSVIAGKPDPASEDLDLREKLIQNSALYKKKEEEIINMFVEQQTALRLEPEPVDDDGLVTSTEPPTVPEISTPVQIEIDVPLEPHTAVVSTMQLPVEIMPEIGAIPSTSSASDSDILRTVAYDYIPFGTV